MKFTSYYSDIFFRGAWCTESPHLDNHVVDAANIIDLKHTFMALRRDAKPSAPLFS